MSGLAGIAVKAVEETGNAGAILHQIAALLENLLHGGVGGTIDLRGLPLRSCDYQALDAALGHGEVTAEIDALGPTKIRETAIHGVWRVTHCNAAGEVVAELVEVAGVPALLAAPPDDMREGLAVLRARLQGGTQR